MNSKHTKQEEVQAVRLASLAEGMRGVSAVCGSYYAEASAVCLAEQGHALTASLQVTGSYADRFLVIRDEVTDQIRASHGDAEKATENGAYGISILVVANLTKLEVIQQSRRGTGFDYSLAPIGSFLFREIVRLEITGIRRGNGAEIARRVKERRARFKRFYDQAMPSAIIVVIEFSQPVAHIVKL